MIMGRYAIRLCVLNHTSGEDDVRHALERVASAALGPAVPSDAGDGSDRALRQAAVAGPWLAAHDVTPTDLRKVLTFQSVSDAQAMRFLGAAHEESVAPGQELTERWGLGRTFYIILEGRLSVRVDNHEVNVLSPGDHLGEIAAIDWGRDFSYGRTATVTALEPVRVLAFPAATLRELMAEAPDVDRSIRLIAQTRLRSR